VSLLKHSKVAITDTVFSVELHTYALKLSGENATDCGVLPTFIVSITESVDVFITDTVLLVELHTYALVPFGETEIATGSPTTVIDKVTVFVDVSIIDTELLLLQTYTFDPFGKTEIPYGLVILIDPITVYGLGFNKSMFITYTNPIVRADT
jgi:hypothetical protein